MLDLDGDLYGDEQERLRWYEATAVAASVQWFLVPWVLAVLIWAANGSATVPLLIVAAAVYLPLLLLSAYAKRHRVRTLPDRWSRKRIVLTVASALPYLVIIGGAVRALVLQASGWPMHGMPVGMLIGLPIGLAGGVFAIRAARRREQAHENDSRDQN
jgi:hypothetical protein